MKCSMYGSFRNVTTGMGASAFSKTLTPWHYGDTMGDPWRTLILLIEGLGAVESPLPRLGGGARVPSA